MNKTSIGRKEAKLLAEEAGRSEWKDFIVSEASILKDGYLEGEGAWMFFRHPDIEIPDHASLRKCAIVISKHGEVRYTADFSPDVEECKKYLQIMSDHFAEKNL